MFNNAMRHIMIIIKNPRQMLPRLLVLLVAGLFVLSSCALQDLVTKEAILLPCPNYHILADASVRIKFQPGLGRDLTDVDHSANIENARISCKSNIDHKTLSGTMDIDVEMFLTAEKGPVNQRRLAEIPYFISITNLQKKILYRESFNIGIKFPRNKTRISIVTKPITLELPIKKKGSGKDYLIYLGLELTADELEFSRERVPK